MVITVALLTAAMGVMAQTSEANFLFLGLWIFWEKKDTKRQTLVFFLWMKQRLSSCRYIDKVYQLDVHFHSHKPPGDFLTVALDKENFDLKYVLQEDKVCP